jgi:hypothetical protein
MRSDVLESVFAYSPSGERKVLEPDLRDFIHIRFLLIFSFAGRNRLGVSRLCHHKSLDERKAGVDILADEDNDASSSLRLQRQWL